MTIALLHRAGVECTGSYGAALAWCLSRERIQVVGVNQPDRRAAVTPKTWQGPAADLCVLRLACARSASARGGPGLRTTGPAPPAPGPC
jgi:hypothetical protein